MRVGAAPPRRFVTGRAWALDDSFEHEAWNGGSAPRYILLAHVCHPDLG
jgi:hypothetical protein